MRYAKNYRITGHSVPIINRFEFIKEKIMEIFIKCRSLKTSMEESNNVLYQGLAVGVYTPDNFRTFMENANSRPYEIILVREHDLSGGGHVAVYEVVNRSSSPAATATVVGTYDRRNAEIVSLGYLGGLENILHKAASIALEK